MKGSILPSNTLESLFKDLATVPDSQDKISAQAALLKQAAAEGCEYDDFAWWGDYDLKRFAGRALSCSEDESHAIAAELYTKLHPK